MDSQENVLVDQAGRLEEGHKGAHEVIGQQVVIEPVLPLFVDKRQQNQQVHRYRAELKGEDGPGENTGVDHIVEEQMLHYLGYHEE